MPVAAVTGAVGLYAAHESSKANDKAVDAQQQASGDAIAEQRREYDMMRGDLAPYTGAGNNALAELGRINAGHYEGFENSPDYLYARDQAKYVIDHGAAAAGDLYSGGHSLDLGREIAGIAAQNFQGYRNNLMQLALMGQSSAARTGASGMDMADNIGSYLGYGADAAARGYQNQADINGTLASGLGAAVGDWWNGRAASAPLPATNGVELPSTPPPELELDWGF